MTACGNLASQTAVATIPGVALYLQPTRDLTIDTQVSRTQYQFTLQATTLDALSHWVPKLQNALYSRYRNFRVAATGRSGINGTGECRPRQRQPFESALADG
ncbi:hypothetical protein KCP76_00225 [Salmonella enterica subsp. enterica serovar Weltevreden]|nr:hypothetical protein KCP76_00225 [Salmonella enterica subsp. enterica serovar Weltevreden]